MRRMAVLVLVVLGVLGLGAISILAGHSAQATQSELAKARKDATTAQHVADLAVQQGQRLAARADSALQRASRDSARADSVGRRYAADRRKFQVAALTAPDSCVAVVQAALDALVDADSLLDLEREHAAAAQDAARSERTRADTLEAALVKLRAADATLDVAAAHVAVAAHRSALARLLPRPGAGVAFGVDALGQPHLIAGVTFGWSF